MNDKDLFEQLAWILKIRQDWLDGEISVSGFEYHCAEFIANNAPDLAELPARLTAEVESNLLAGNGFNARIHELSAHLAKLQDAANTVTVALSTACAEGAIDGDNPAADKLLDAAMAMDIASIEATP